MTRSEIARNMWQRVEYRARQRRGRKRVASLLHRLAVERWERDDYREKQRLAHPHLGNVGPHTRRCCGHPRLGHPARCCGGRLRRRGSK